MRMTIRKSLVEAFARTWSMCQDAIESIAEEHWQAGDIEYLIPARIMYHVLETADFYSSSTPEGFVWGQRFKTEGQPDRPEKSLTKEQAQTYLKEIVEKVDGWLQGMNDAAFLAAEKAFPWTGSAVLGRALYLLVHCHQHLGEINAELRQRGLPRVKWR